MKVEIWPLTNIQTVTLLTDLKCNNQIGSGQNNSAAPLLHISFADHSGADGDNNATINKYKSGYGQEIK